MDGFDIVDIRLSPVYTNLVITCSEDELMGFFNVENDDEDDFTVFNVEESA